MEGGRALPTSLLPSEGMPLGLGLGQLRMVLGSTFFCFLHRLLFALSGDRQWRRLTCFQERKKRGIFGISSLPHSGRQQEPTLGGRLGPGRRQGLTCMGLPKTCTSLLTFPLPTHTIPFSCVTGAAARKASELSCLNALLLSQEGEGPPSLPPAFPLPMKKHFYCNHFAASLMPCLALEEEENVCSLLLSEKRKRTSLRGGRRRKFLEKTFLPVLWSPLKNGKLYHIVLII